MNHPTIKSNNSDRTLSFTAWTGDYFSVTLDGNQIRATKGIWVYSEIPYLIEFFDFIACHWKGWEGEKTWSSIEADLTLTASSDKLGHITIEVEMRNNQPEDDWSVSAPIQIDSSDAEMIVKHIRYFFK